MNDMTINQAATVLTEVVKQATGQAVMGAIATPEDFTAVAQTALKTGRDPIFNQISQMWTDTIFAVRPNQRPVSTLRMEIGRFGNAVRKLSPVAKQMVNDESFLWPVAYDASKTGKELGNGESCNYGSVKKYFSEVSDGQFTPNFKIVGPVTVPQSMKYYGANGSYTDQNYCQFVKDACAAASALQPFNADEFDSDANGCVDLVAIMFAGYGENNAADPNTLWAKTSLQDFDSYNGKSVKSAMLISELNANESLLNGNGFYSKPRINGVGVFCHEMSHAMGLPDFYSTTSPANENDNQELEYWSLMDGGENVFNGYYPVAYTAFERKHMGWSDYVEMEDGKTYSLTTADKGGRGHVYHNPNTLAAGRVSDYFVFENIQNTGWNSKLPGHGLIAYRVSLRISDMQDNTPINNIVGDPGFTIVPADGCLLNINNTTGSNSERHAAYKNSMAADPFPGTLKVTTLLATQNLPNFAWRDAPKDNKMGLYNIVEDTESTHEVSFRFVADVTTSGLQNVVTDAPLSTDNRIFSIDGICLGTDLSVLPKGLYIIGGKKVVKQ